MEIELEPHLTTMYLRRGVIEQNKTHPFPVGWGDGEKERREEGKTEDARVTPVISALSETMENSIFISFNIGWLTSEVCR